MKVINKLKDTEFPNIGISHTRNIVRGIILNGDNKIALLKIKRDDIFGKANYYETPGGGKKQFESLKDALIREIDEELGYKIKVIQEIGLVEDAYNLIMRHNMNHYFLGRIVEKTMVHLESFGDSFIDDIVWVSIDEAISLYEQMSDSGVAKLVKNRELPILHIVKKILGGK